MESTAHGILSIVTSDELPALIEARVSVPDAETAQQIAREVVSQQIAACVQVVGPVASIYTWKEEVHQASEWLLLIKTVSASFQRLTDLVVSMHRYDVPEIMAVPITHTLESYGGWVRTNSAGTVAEG